MHVMLLPVFAICLVLIPCGVVLIWTGLWARRRGTMPHCRQCEYNLTGLSADRCPECGTPLAPLGPVHGERHRSMIRVAAGLLCLAPLVAAVVLIVPRINWYQHYPSGWVLDDLQSAAPGPSSKAWRELTRRDAAGDLSAKQRSRLIDLCLRQQGLDAPGLPTYEMVDYLGKCSIAGHLSQSQQSTFFGQIGLLTLQVRPRVSPGHRVPYWISAKCRGPSDNLWMTLDDAEIIIDGRPTGHTARLSGGSSSGYGAGGGHGGAFDCPAPGEHTVQIRPHVLVYDGSSSKAGDRKPVHRHEVPLAATFEVLAEVPQEHIRLVRDQSVQQALHAAIQPKDFVLRAAKHGKPSLNWSGTFEFRAVPANVAFDVIVRSGDREQSAARFHMVRGSSTNWRFSWIWEGGAVTSCDVILRASPEEARNTVDLFEIWDGELVYENVPVRVDAESAASNEAE